MSNRARRLRAADDLRDNPGQWAAYESAGHCVVLAGPGSGKTRTLTVKMARMLDEDVPEPRGIACITYSNECARELEERLALLGVEPGGRVFVGTVHSFSLTQIILPYAKSAGMELPDGFGVATRSEQAEAMAQALAEAESRPLGQEWEKSILQHRRAVLNRDSAAWLSNPQLSDLVEAYERQLRDRCLIDLDDMPLLAVRALRSNPWLQRALLAKYPVLVVDEYQDLGPALHRMVMGLCFSTGMRLFAVGDTDQSIYGFNGARPDLLQALSERSDVSTVRLQVNYRCGNLIVAASRAALGHDRGYQSVKGAKQGGVFVHPIRARYEAQSRQLVRELLPEALSRHPHLGLRNVAVLYPAAWIGDNVATASRDAKLAFVRTDSKALYPRNSRLMQWLEVCGQWCCGGWRSGSPSFSKVLRDGRRLFAETIYSEAALSHFHREITECLWNRRDPALSLHLWLNDVVRQVIEPFCESCYALNDELETLALFMSRVEPGANSEGMTVGSFAGYGGAHDRLTLSTLHSAKGKEFDLVFMIGMDGRYFPHPNSSAKAIEESRRLFYVGFTRAKAEIHLLYTAGGASPFVTDVEDYLAQH